LSFSISYLITFYIKGFVLKIFVHEIVTHEKSREWVKGERDNILLKKVSVLLSKRTVIVREYGFSAFVR